MSIYNLLQGAGSVLELFPSYDEEITMTDLSDDANALANDWQNVGKDMYQACAHAREIVEHNEQQSNER